MLTGGGAPRSERRALGRAVRGRFEAPEIARTASIDASARAARRAQGLCAIWSLCGRVDVGEAKR
jgi:hypothetical protein